LLGTSDSRPEKSANCWEHQPADRGNREIAASLGRWPAASGNTPQPAHSFPSFTPSPPTRRARCRG
jgi:hypothetical protein